MYKIAHFAQPVITQCTDLGVSYDTHLSFSTHISRVVSTASGRAKCILKCFSSHDSSILLLAFCTFVRPLLEFSSIIWSPYYIKDINKIESVQRYYKERLLNLNLDSLQYRCLKADFTVKKFRRYTEHFFRIPTEPVPYCAFPFINGTVACLFH